MPHIVAALLPASANEGRLVCWQALLLLSLAVCARRGHTGLDQVGIRNTEQRNYGVCLGSGLNRQQDSDARVQADIFWTSAESPLLVTAGVACTEMDS
jgi:hypothetical protein